MFGTIFSGTGSVIGKKQIGNDFWLCVLTANHVVANANRAWQTFAPQDVEVGIKNLRGPMFRTSFIFTALDSVNNPNDPHRNFFGQDRPDIALIGVRVNQQVFNQVASYTMAQPGHYTDFTIVGYGYTGVTDRDTDGNFIGYTMVRVPETSGTKRFANNTVSMRFVGNSPAGAPFRGGLSGGISR